MRQLCTLFALLLACSQAFSQSAPVPIPPGEMTCAPSVYPGNPAITWKECTFPVVGGNYTNPAHLESLMGGLLIPGPPLLTGLAKIRALNGGHSAVQKPGCSDWGMAETNAIVTRNCYSHFPNYFVYPGTFTSWGGAWKGTLDFGWRMGALFNYIQSNHSSIVDWNAGLEFFGTSEGGSASIMQSFMLPDPYWQSRITIVNATVPATLFMRQDAPLGNYWRDPTVRKTWGNPDGGVQLFDWHQGNILEQTQKIKNIYFRVNGSPGDVGVVFDLDFFRRVCDDNKIACFGTWHNNGHNALEAGNNVPLAALFSGPDSKVRLDRMLPVFTRSTGNAWGARGHYNLGLEWHSEAYNIDSASLVLLPIRYRQHTNLGLGQPDQPSSITTDITLRRIVNFQLPQGRVVTWTVNAHGSQPVQTGQVTVTTAGEVTVPNVTLSTISNTYTGFAIQPYNPAPVSPWKVVYTRQPMNRSPIPGGYIEVSGPLAGTNQTELSNHQYATDVTRINSLISKADVVVDALDGTTPKVIHNCTGPGTPNCIAQEAKVSPDGTKIAYSVGFGGPSDLVYEANNLNSYLHELKCAQIYIYDIASDTSTPIGNHPGGDCATNYNNTAKAIDRQPAWLSNTELLFVTNRANKWPHREQGNQHLARCFNYPYCVSQTYPYGDAGKAMQLWKMNINGTGAVNWNPEGLNSLSPEVLANGDVVFSCFNAHGDKGMAPGQNAGVASPNLMWLCRVDGNGADMTVKLHGHKQNIIKTREWLPVEPTIGGIALGRGSLIGFEELRGLRSVAEIFKGKTAMTSYYRSNHSGSLGAIYSWVFGVPSVEGCSKETCLQYPHAPGTSTFPGSAKFIPKTFKSITAWGQSGDDMPAFEYRGAGIPYRSFGKAGYPAPWDANNYLITHAIGQCYHPASGYQVSKVWLGTDSSCRRRIMKVSAPNGASTAIPTTTNPWDVAQMTPLVDDLNYQIWDAKPIKTYSSLFGQAAPTRPAPLTGTACYLQVVNAKNSELFNQPSDYRQAESTMRCGWQGCAVKPYNEDPNYVYNNMTFLSVSLPVLFDFSYIGNNALYKNTMNTVGFKDIKGYQRVKLQSDGSVNMRVPCDTPLLISGENAAGERIVHDDFMHSLRPGEKRTCYGCHDGHSEERYAELGNTPPLPVFNTKLAAAIVPTGSVAKTLPKWAQIQPILTRTCGSCHAGFNNDSLMYSRIVWDTNQLDMNNLGWTTLPVYPVMPGVQNNGLWRPLTSRFVSKFALESPLYWYASNRRTDGRSNSLNTWDIDYYSGHPVSGVTAAEKALIRDWLDNGAAYQ